MFLANEQDSREDVPFVNRCGGWGVAYWEREEAYAFGGWVWSLDLVVDKDSFCVQCSRQRDDGHTEYRVSLVKK